MSSYSNYIRDYNLSRCHNRVFNDVLRNRTKTSSTKPMSFSTNYESSKKSLAKQDNLNKIKNALLNSWNGSTVITPSSKSSTDTSKTKSTDSTKKRSSTSTSSKENTNSLNIGDGKSFNVTLSHGENVTFSCENGQVYMSRNSGNLTSSDMHEVAKIEQLITSLVHDASGNYVKSNFSREEIKDVLGKVGIKPGKLSVGNNKFYMLDSGKLYSNYEIECERNFYNNTNFIKCFGYSTQAVCTIGGTDYKIGKDGYFKIPSGVICVPENMTIKK